jgi:hypothetical protein
LLLSPHPTGYMSTSASFSTPACRFCKDTPLLYGNRSIVHSHPTNPTRRPTPPPSSRSPWRPRRHPLPTTTTTSSSAAAATPAAHHESADTTKGGLERRASRATDPGRPWPAEVRIRPRNSSRAASRSPPPPSPHHHHHVLLRRRRHSRGPPRECGYGQGGLEQRASRATDPGRPWPAEVRIRPRKRGRAASRAPSLSLLPRPLLRSRSGTALLLHPSFSSPW